MKSFPLFKPETIDQRISRAFWKYGRPVMVNPSVIIAIIDSYPETNFDTYYPISVVHPSSGIYYSALGQTFQTPASPQYSITSCKFYLRKNASPVGILKVRIYAHTGTWGSTGVPTGSALASSDGVAMENLTSDYQLITFVFSGVNRIILSASTNYCISLEADSATTLDSTNYVNVGLDTASPTHAGNAFHYNYSDWGAEGTGVDIIFYLYGLA